jgi:hypothetical protein
VADLGTRLAALSVGVVSLLLLSGCSVLGGSDETLLDVALETQAAVQASASEIPAEWILGRDENGSSNDSDPSSCNDIIDEGPGGQSQWSYGFALDLVKQVSNADLLEAMTPSGDAWTLTSTEPGTASDEAMLYQFESSNVTLVLSIDGENPERPRVGLSGYSKCVRNGSTGPGTFPTPVPTDMPTPAPAGE